MTTQETTEKNIVSKHSDVVPSSWHIIPYPSWYGYVSVDGEMTFTKTYKSKKRAVTALQKLKEKLDYDSIKTMQCEGCYPERAKIMEELYVKDGRRSKDHPMYGFFTGLAEKDV